MKIPLSLLDALRVMNHVAVLTGAGVSSESGLQTFREANSLKSSSQSLWTMYRPEDLATPEAFERDPELVWDFYAMRRLKAGEVAPNSGHFALAQMGRLIRHFSLITQNVDGLHQRAGSVNVIELHGNITRVRCTKGCGVFSEWVDSAGAIPLCPRCNAKLRPDVVWFGEMLPTAALQAAQQAALNCQMFFSIGTSSLVQPAASLPLIAKQQGAMLVEINLDETPLTGSTDYFLQGKSGEILPELVHLVWNDRTVDFEPENC